MVMLGIDIRSVVVITLKPTLLKEAGPRISSLQGAVDIGMATDDEIAGLTLCKKCPVLPSRIDTDISSTVTWPGEPEY
ncbi:tail fiber assembly protein [Rosenbergiella australiborealis]|uniref:Tail fiber assembly protein n=1 Tax=Rosenbergiella australiborealis TaxID=1544696 RepID=A0ABS5T0R7_9GAMM|nr:tail fiber assembly protein [Rosenbergiella australiborealis]MBT0725948.1 tail fiber assembly protein [Rosenbergiella australiborealis]